MIVSASNDVDDGISRIGSWIWRWKYTIFGPMLVCAFLAISSFAYVPAQYTSQAVLIMDVRQRQVLPGESFISPLPQENPVVKTELDIISSRNTAAHVMKLLADRGVELTPPSEKVGPVALLARTLRDILGAGISSALALDEPEPAALTTTPQDRSVIDDLLAGLRVSNDGHSYTIFIEYVSPDPIFAAAAANAFADAYLEKQLQIYDDAAAKAGDVLGPRVESLRAQLEETEQRRQARRQAAGLTPDGDGSLLAQRLADLSTEQAAVNAAIAEARARLEAAKAGSPTDGTNVDSPRIAELIATKSQLERQHANLIDGGALKSQMLSEIEQGLTATNDEIAAEFHRILGRLSQEIVVQERKKSILESEIERMRSALEENAGAVIEIAQLDREVEASSAIYESFLSRYKETIEQQGIAVPDARLISTAEPGVRDGAGALVKLLITSLVIGAAVGTTTALGRSAIAIQKASPEGVAATTDAAIFGYLPRLSARDLNRPDLGATDPASDTGAAFAMMQVNAMLPPPDGSCAVVAITSVAQGDGRTTVAKGLGHSIAASGARCLLVDFDFAEPQATAQPGTLRPVPITAAKSDAAVGLLANVQKVAGHCDVLALGGADKPASLVLQIRRLEAMIQEARGAYDVVILDCPAMNDHPEVRHMTGLADLAIHVVRWPRSRMSDVAAALSDLQTTIPQGRVGTVFTRMTQGKQRSGPLQGESSPISKVKRIGQSVGSAMHRIKAYDNNFRTTRLAIPFLAAICLSCGPLFAQEATYNVHQGDRIAVAVIGMPDQSGEYAINVDGTLTHPLAGDVAAVGRTISDLRADLTARLGAYFPSPSLAVSIAAYAPVFAVGDVERNGEYEYRPGMTALQLLAMSGGPRRVVLPEQDGALAIITAERDYADLSLQSFSNQVALARFTAERDTVALNIDVTPPAVVPRAEADKIVRNEQTLFDLRNAARRSEDAGLAAQADSYQSEIAFLEKSIALHDDELKLLSEDVQAASQLVDRGLSTPARLREIQRTQSATRRDALDLQAALARARQGSLDVQRRRDDAAATFRSAAGDGVRQTELRIASLELSREVVRKTLLTYTGSPDPSQVSAPLSNLRFSVLRAGANGLAEQVVSENAAIEPGDVLRVERMEQNDRLLALQ